MHNHSFIKIMLKARKQELTIVHFHSYRLACSRFQVFHPGKQIAPDQSFLAAVRYSAYQDKLSIKV